MLFTNLSYANLVNWCGLNKKRDFRCTVIDREASGCKDCTLKKCKSCSHKVEVDKFIPFVAHGKNSYYSTKNSFFRNRNKTQILLMLYLLSCNPADDGKVDYVRLSVLSQNLCVCKKTIVRNLLSLAKLGIISYTGVSDGIDIYYNITIKRYADTFKKLADGGSQYAAMSHSFVANLINLVVHNADYDINALRVALYIMVLLVNCKSQLVDISRSMLYSFLPTYARGVQLRNAIRLLNQLGFTDNSDSDSSITISLPPEYNKYYIRKGYCDDAARDLEQVRYTEIPTIWSFLKDRKDIRDSLYYITSSYGWWGTTLQRTALRKIEVTYSATNFERWCKSPNDFIKLYSKVMSNYIQDRFSASCCHFSFFSEFIQRTALSQSSSMCI